MFYKCISSLIDLDGCLLKDVVPILLLAEYHLVK